jgi:Zn-dependent protease with chaperone function
MGSHFFDGSSPKRYEVTLEIWPEGISFETERGPLNWLYKDLIRLWDYRPGDHLAFTHRKHQDARLVIEEADAVSGIGQHAPGLLNRSRERLRSVRVAAALAGGILVLVAAIYFLVPPIADRMARAIPWSFEEKDAPDLTQLERFIGKPCTASRPNQILQGMTDRLLNAANFPHPITVQVTDRKIPNAFTFPGGKIALLRGLIDKARTPNEVAAVIGHEIGHVVNRDHTERWIRNNVLSAATTLLFGFNPTGSVGEALFQSGLSLSFSREDEDAADVFAIDLLNQLDLDPSGGAAFFERLSKSGGLGGVLPGYLSTHPESDGRAGYFREHGTGTKQALSPADWLILKQICIKNG